MDLNSEYNFFLLKYSLLKLKGFIALFISYTNSKTNNIIYQCGQYENLQWKQCLS